MNESTPTEKESIGSQLIEDISNIQQIALGEGAVVCQVCGAVLSGGSRVSVFVYRRAGEPAFELGHVVCGDNEHELRTHFTLGVRELVVDGRVGRCVDQALQSSWPVLLDPVVRVVSTMGSRTGCVAPGRAVGEGLSGESSVSWVFGDALLERVAGSDDAGGGSEGGDGLVGAVDGGSDGDDTVSVDGEGSPSSSSGCDGSRGAGGDGLDAVPADADGSSTAGTGPAGSDDVVLADADDSGDDSADGTSSDVDGGEC